MRSRLRGIASASFDVNFHAKAFFLSHRLISFYVQAWQIRVEFWLL